MSQKEIDRKLEQKGVSRRDFMKFCGLISATLGLGASFIPKIAQALTGPRPPIVWLHFSECTGCSEAFLRTTSPMIDALLLENVSVEYHETVMIAAGSQATANLDNSVAANKGQFICVVEGAIPTAQNGVFGMVGGKTMLSIAQEIIPQAKVIGGSPAVIAMGTCAAYGGLPAAFPNDTGAKGVRDAIGVKTINIPGCPPNPINLISTIVSYLLTNKLPALDTQGRPTFAYGKRVHENCPKPKPFECLKDFGCKGPSCYNNCHSVKYNDKTSWCIQAGHHCVGCSEPQFWDRFTPLYSREFVKKLDEKIKG